MASKQVLPQEELGAHALQLQLLTLQMELAKKDTELAKKDTELAKKDAELAIAKKDVEIERLKMQEKYQRLETQLRDKNWQDLKTNKKIYIRSFFKIFGEMYLRKLTGDWDNKLSTFLKTARNVLNEWHFETIRDFEDIYWKLYDDMNRTAHPLFIKADAIEIPNTIFEKNEFRVLGFMWDVCQYPLNKFMISYNSKPDESVATLKKGWVQTTKQETKFF